MRLEFSDSGVSAIFFHIFPPLIFPSSQMPKSPHSKLRLKSLTPLGGNSLLSEDLVKMEKRDVYLTHKTMHILLMFVTVFINILSI